MLIRKFALATLMRRMCFGFLLFILSFSPKPQAEPENADFLAVWDDKEL